MDKTKNFEALILAHSELVLQHEELKKCSAELTIANKQLIVQHKEKDQRAVELISVNDSLEKSQGQQKEHIQGLEKMMFMISHNIRQPVAHILGLSNLLDNEKNISQETKQMLEFMKQSAQSLDGLTRELSIFIQEKKIESENVS